MADRKDKKVSLDSLSAQEEKILRILREERSLLKQKIPLAYALFATFGVVATWTGFNKVIQEIPFLNNNPIVLIVVGVSILLITGMAYKKLG